MSKFALAFVLAAVSACGGDDSQATPDAPSGPMCTKALYDNCATNADCTSGNCHFFMQSNFSICTQACSTTTPCPVDSTGVAGQCNNMGICKPAAANNCHL
ncbi:MAG TPA: hypothetical protein VMZ53_04475 [Kofleriaceae bacterium]|nr:hypothetical protein [Kofleriaceae bacterium]